MWKLVFVVLILSQPAFAQDSSGALDDILSMLASKVGVQVGTLAVILLIIQRVCEIIHKSIPDTAKGWVHWVDKACQYVAMYRSSGKKT